MIDVLLLLGIGGCIYQYSKCYHKSLLLKSLQPNNPSLIPTIKAPQVTSKELMKDWETSLRQKYPNTGYLNTFKNLDEVEYPTLPVPNLSTDELSRDWETSLRQKYPFDVNVNPYEAIKKKSKQM